MHQRLVSGLAITLLAGAAGACVSAGNAAQNEPSIRQGKAYIAQWGCGSCHTIPGIRTADGVVAPPLTAFGRRAYIAGEVPNTPENLVRWLISPQSIEPNTAMPNMGISDPVARSMAAYLYTLR